jgi:Protein of unknown function DUF84
MSEIIKYNEKVLAVLASESQLKIQALQNTLDSLNLTKNVEIIGVPASSEVAEEPCGIDQTTIGCQNRLRNAVRLMRKEIGNAKILFFAVENGITTISSDQYKPISTLSLEEADSNNQLNTHYIPDMYMDEREEWFDFAHCMLWIPNVELSGVRASKIIDGVRGGSKSSQSQYIQFPTKSVIKTWNKGENKINGFKNHTVGETMQQDGIVKSSKDPHIDLPPYKSRLELLSDSMNKLF